jgi:hypothetical protein
LEFGWLEAECGGVKCARDFPKLLGTAGCGVNALCVAAGQCFVFFVADEKDGKGTSGNGLFGGDFGDGKAGEFFATVEEHPAEGSEERFAKPGTATQPGIIVRRFAPMDSPRAKMCNGLPGRGSSEPTGFFKSAPLAGSSLHGPDFNCSSAWYPTSERISASTIARVSFRSSQP